MRSCLHNAYGSITLQPAVVGQGHGHVVDAQDRRTAPQRLRNGGEDRRTVRVVKEGSVERLPLCSLDALEHLLPPCLGILYFVEGVDVESVNPAIRIAEVRTQLLD